MQARMKTYSSKEVPIMLDVLVYLSVSDVSALASMRVESSFVGIEFVARDPDTFNRNPPCLPT
jgi:hypothetical protein